MAIKQHISSAVSKWRALPRKKKIIYGVTFVIAHIIGVIVLILGHKIQSNLEPVAQKMDQTPYAWLLLSFLIALVSIPPLFGHEIFALIAGYVYGIYYGFAILAISSIVGESGVYFAIRYWFRGYLENYRAKHANYGIFVAVVEDGGILMLWFIRMSVIPPHLSTPLFASLENITWLKWMAANIAASPVKFFPPVFIGTLLRNKGNNSVIGDVVFVVSSIVTVAVLWHINKSYKQKKQEQTERLEKEIAELKDAEIRNGSPTYESFPERSTGVEMTSFPEPSNSRAEYYPGEPGKAHVDDGSRWV